jgi:hypothetical protein
MKGLLVSSLLLASLNCFAQRKELQITFGDVPPSKIENGKVQNTQTSSDILLRNPRLVSNIPSVTVKEFVFSLLPKGENYYGPFHIKGAELPEEQKKRLQSFPEGRVFIESIKVAEPDGTIRTCVPILISFSN